MMEVNDIRLFKETDIYLVPFCLLVIYLIAFISAKKYEGTGLKRLFYRGLNLRLFFAVIYALVLQFYYEYGDTFMYYRAVQDMHRAVSDDLSILPDILTASKAVVTDRLYPYFMFDGISHTDLYMMNPSNFAVPKFALIFSILFAKSYLCISFCLCLYAFGGCWRLFKMFYEMYPELKKKLAIASLFLPSLLFWGSGFLKDTICIGSLGFMLYAAYSIFIKRRKLVSSTLILIIMAYILLSIKPYILLSVFAAMIIWILLVLRNRIKNRSVRIVFGAVFFVVGLVTIFGSIEWLTNAEVAAQFSSERLLETVQQQHESSVASSGTNFNLGRVENSSFGLILLVPAGLMATYFRPFLWEVNNPLMVLSALEALGFLILTFLAFRRIGFRRFFAIAFSDPILIFCLVFSITFGALVGISTNNFGALVRYKIPSLSCYLFLFFIVMHKSGKFSPDYIFSKRFF
ncbi:MAG: hypothetical protein E6Q24_13295 [Chitinophagaceae bacterium]|jgi:hypothetical protein|nr:MAG: hypothetical protein E6Q24_13295 [Chitinophagaceae bacterium]